MFRAGIGGPIFITVINIVIIISTYLQSSGVTLALSSSLDLAKRSELQGDPSRA